MIQLGIKVRKISEILDVAVSTLYYHSVKANKDITLATLIQDIAFKYTFYGYRRIHIAIKRLGVNINVKRLYLIYKTLNLQRPKPRKSEKLCVVGMPLTKPLFCNHVWAVDFLFDALSSGRKVKILAVEDLFNRLSLNIDVVIVSLLRGL